jgi:hypothetical protein
MKTSGSSIFQNQTAFINPNSNFNDTKKKIETKNNSNTLGMRNAGSSNISGKNIFGGNAASKIPASPTKTGKNIFAGQHQIQTQSSIPESNQPSILKNVFTGMGDISNMSIEKNINTNSNNNIFNQTGIFGNTTQQDNNFSFGIGIFGNQSSNFNLNNNVNMDMGMDIDMNSTNTNKNINNTLSSSNKVEDMKDNKGIKSKEIKNLEEFENVVSEMFEIPIIF